MSPFCVFLALALVVAPALASVEYINVAPGIQRVIHRHKLMAAGPTELLLGLDLSAAGNLTLSHLSESGVQPGSYIRKPPPFIETYVRWCCVLLLFVALS